MSEAILTVTDLVAGYGAAEVLHGISLHVLPGEIVSVLGANGAGKTTTLGALSGTVRSEGAIVFAGEQIGSLSPDARARRGLGHAPQGRGTFVDLSVEDNLRIGGMRLRRAELAERLDDWYRTFPVLGERRTQRAGNLSGGEQQMLAIARSLIDRPALLMLDEPSLGLSPRLTDQVIGDLRRICDDTGTAMLLVEQNATKALEIADRAYVLQAGSFVAEGSAHELTADETVRRAYLGA
ncbi:ABC transporter ATP-binding protein [Pseudonocardia sp. RS010]|uniref:ABC transporter ATP-binding protein n=1 Tax=Pseudonocardia sp. RS010 TaxID=3385979 RepID=UPI00399F2183